MIVTIGAVDNLHIVAARHEERCSTFSLVGADGTTFRYAPPLYVLHRTN
jgi:hypothetical protein